MKVAEKEIITAFLGKTLNLAPERVASLFVKNGDDEDLAPNALETLTAADAERVQSFKTKGETQFDNGYKKAQAETLAKLEKDMKEKAGIESDKKGIELFEEILSTAAKHDNKLDADKIKIHPEFLKLEKDWKKAAAAELEAKAQELETFKSQVAQEKTFSNVAKKFETSLQALKPILSKDPNKAANQKSVVLDKLKGYTFQENGDDEPIVLKDGKRLEDKHGKPISFSTLVKETAGEYFDFEDGGHHSGTGAENTNGTNGAPGKEAGVKTKWTGRIPQNEEDRVTLFASLKTPEERMSFQEAVAESSKNG
jgi:hypothetical protein